MMIPKMTSGQGEQTAGNEKHQDDHKRRHNSSGGPANVGSLNTTHG